MRLASLLLLAGCDALFHIDEFHHLDAAQEIDASPSGCPTTYTKIGNGYYRFEPNGFSWATAEANCVADGLALARKHTHLIVGDAVELEAVFQWLQPTRSMKAWIGLNDGVSQPPQCGTSPSGFYQWVTNDPLPVPPASAPPWYPGDPMYPCDQFCIELLPDQPSMDDNTCNNPWTSICECDDFAEDKSHF